MAGCPFIWRCCSPPASSGRCITPSTCCLSGRARAQSGHRVQLVFTLLIFLLLSVVYQLVFGANLQTLGHRFGSVQIFGGVLTTAQLVAIVLAVLVSVVLYVVTRYTMLGKLTYVASRYPLGARSIGVPVERIYTSVFVLSGVLAGLAGGVMVTFQPVQPTLALQYSLVVFLVALVARTHLLGCLVLGFAYGIVQSVLANSINASTASTLTLVVFLVALVGENVMKRLFKLYQRIRPRGAVVPGATR